MKKIKNNIAALNPAGRHRDKAVPERVAKRRETDNPRYSRVSIYLGAAIVGCLILALIFSLNSPKLQTRQYAAALPLVETIPVKKSALRIPIHVQGIAQPATQMLLLAEVSGKLKQANQYFVDGGYFKAGDELLHIDPRPFELEIVKKRAAIDSKKLSLNKIEAEYSVASNSQQNSPTLLDRYRRQIRNAQSQLEAAQADLALSQYRLEKTRIVAPFNGRIKQVNVSGQQYLRQGETLATLYSLENMEIRLPISDKQLNLLGRNILIDSQNPQLSSSALPKATVSAQWGNQQHTWPGRLVRSTGGRDNNQLLALVVQVKQKTRDTAAKPLLAPGTFVDVAIHSNTFSDIAVLPSSVMHNQNQLWLVDARERLALREVAVLYHGKHQVYIQQGLQDGERVVLQGSASAVENMRVQFVMQQPPKRETLQ
ncbi:MAG: efflux RND transporter periplasmic adaptor subunit [Cellvibrionaceae bacterium]|nr:efflux RND transporter periplasmic adaptor subunit [Cellvibrionaceae bacterium]